MKTYTVETYRPAYPGKGEHICAHPGTFESNRDILSPSMVRAVEVNARNMREAMRQARIDGRKGAKR